MPVFYFFSALLLIFALASVLRKDTLEASMLFLGAVFCASALFILGRAEFLAAAALISYTALAIIVFLFTFLSMDTKERSRKRRLSWFGAIASAGFLGEIILTFLSFAPETECRFCQTSLKLTARDYPMIESNNAWELSSLLYHNLWFLIIVTGIIIFVIMLCVMSVTAPKTPEREEK